MISVQLIPFLSDNSATQYDDDIEVIATLSRSHQEITAEFTLRGDISHIQWPAVQSQPQRGMELWKHTCFELFIADSASHGYWEYNFSPSRQWAVYAFSDYRQPVNAAVTNTPNVDVPRVSDTTFTLGIKFPVDAVFAKKTLSVGVSAVIEYRDGALRYFALAHGAQRPDFHRRDSFLIKLHP